MLTLEGVSDKVRLDDWIANNGTEGYALIATYGDFPSVKLVKTAC